MAIDSLVISALIGLAGIVVGIGGYALQNWFIKKREREAAEFVIKREKYEHLTKVLLEPLYADEEIVSKMATAFNVVTNQILLYGSDEVVRALSNFWNVAKKNPGTPLVLDAHKEFVLAMRKDLVKTNLTASEIELLNWGK